MKKQILTLIALSFLVGFKAAALVVPVGDFNYQHRIDLLSVIKTEKVYAGTPQGQKHLEELRNQGWTCVHIQSNYYGCKIFDHEAELPVEIYNKINSKFNNFSFQFSEIYSTDLVNDGEVVDQYAISQSVKINNETVSIYRLDHLVKEDLTKLNFEIKNKAAQYLYLIDVDHIATMAQETIEAKNKRIDYLVQVVFEK